MKEKGPTPCSGELAQAQRTGETNSKRKKSAKATLGWGMTMEIAHRMLSKKWGRKTANMTGTSEESKKKQTTEGAGRKPKDRSTCRWKQKTARAKWPEKSSPNDSFQGKRRADSMPQRQQKTNKKRTHRIGFKFSSFCLKTPPLRFRTSENNQAEKILRLLFLA